MLVLTSLSNLLLSIKDILHGLDVQTIYIIISLVTVYKPVFKTASARIWFPCKFSKWRHYLVDDKATNYRLWHKKWSNTINFGKKRKRQLFELEKKESKTLKSFQKLLEVISKSQQSQASSSKKNVYIYQTWKLAPISKKSSCYTWVIHLKKLYLNIIKLRSNTKQ